MDAFIKKRNIFVRTCKKYWKWINHYGTPCTRTQGVYVLWLYMIYTRTRIVSPRRPFVTYHLRSLLRGVCRSMAKKTAYRNGKEKNCNILIVPSWYITQERARAADTIAAVCVCGNTN